jgi:hypothetical protein
MRSAFAQCARHAAYSQKVAMVSKDTSFLMMRSRGNDALAMHVGCSHPGEQA